MPNPAEAPEVINALQLSHFSDAREVVPRSVTQDFPISGYSKPQGLWVSVDGDDDWPSWASGEDYPIGRNRHRVVLAADAKIMHITNRWQLLDFTEQYGILTPLSSSHLIQWSLLEFQGYEGIIIAPYQWDCRLDNRTSWYYGWDCASGCIWNAKAIESVSLENRALLGEGE